MAERATILAERRKARPASVRARLRALARTAATGRHIPSGGENPLPAKPISGT